MEISYGLIPLKQKQGKWNVFLVQLKSGAHWGFPKGHSEKGETPLQTAFRELKEETSLDPERLLEEKPLIEEYRYQKDLQFIEKKVCYYMALVRGSAEIQKDEILNGGWFSLDEAYEKITYFQSKKTCREVQKRLKINP